MRRRGNNRGPAVAAGSCALLLTFSPSFAASHKKKRAGCSSAAYVRAHEPASVRRLARCGSQRASLPRAITPPPALPSPSSSPPVCPPLLTPITYTPFSRERAKQASKQPATVGTEARATRTHATRPRRPCRSTAEAAAKPSSSFLPGIPPSFFHGRKKEETAPAKRKKRKKASGAFKT